MVIDTDGERLGVYPIREALKLAEEKELDLVEVSPTAKPPVCKLLDYGRFKYELNKKEREARSKKKTLELKEIKFRLKIDDHDFLTKTKLMKKFLAAGDKVKITIMFRGREMVYTSQGLKLLERVAREIGEGVQIEKTPKIEGRNMTMIMAPK